VKCLKNEAIKGYFNITIGGVTFRLTDENKSEFLKQLWIGVGEFLNGQLTEQTAIVPIPNSSGIVEAPPTYRTLVFANAIAAASSGKLIARFPRGAAPDPGLGNERGEGRTIQFFSGADRRSEEGTSPIFSSWRDQTQGRFSCCSRTVRGADCS
jgi:hypothetical protein